jgi:uncharacterized membrane protein (GlpM family)
MLFDAFWLSVLMKMAAAAVVVIIASTVAERAGPYLGGLIAALPVSAGPAYVFLAIQTDDAFVGQSALGSVAGNAATALFLLAYCFLGPTRGLAVTLAGAIATWLAAAAVIREIPWTAWTALPFSAAVYIACIRLSARVDMHLKPARLRRRWFDLPARALLVGTLVATVVTVSQAIGPAATGIAASFPISLTSIGVIVHNRLGGQAAAAAMASAIRGMLGLVVGLWILHLTAVPLGSAWAMLLALATCFVWSGVILVLRRRAARARR